MTPPGRWSWAPGGSDSSIIQRARGSQPGDAAVIGAAFRRRCEVAGVFVNPTLDEVAGAVENAGLTMVQLNGEEGPSLCAEIARRTGAKVIKAIHLSSVADLQAAEAYPTDFHMFDSRRGALRGGTGRAFDWELLRGRPPGSRRSSPAASCPGTSARRSR